MVGGETISEADTDKRTVTFTLLMNIFAKFGVVGQGNYDGSLY